MKIHANNVFYHKDDIAQPSKDSNQVKKSVLLAEYRDVLTAVNKGTLTVDGVTLELSDDVRNAIKEAGDQRYKDSEAVNMMNVAIHNVNVAQQQSEVIEEVLDDQAKALEIARRISRGGRVPLQDEQALMEYSPEMYQMAKQSAMMAKEHKKYDTVIEEDAEEMKNYDADDGKIDTKYQVQVDVSLGDSPTVEGVSEVAISSDTVSSST